MACWARSSPPAGTAPDSSFVRILPHSQGHAASCQRPCSWQTSPEGVRKDRSRCEALRLTGRSSSTEEQNASVTGCVTGGLRKRDSRDLTRTILSVRGRGRWALRTIEGGGLLSPFLPPETRSQPSSFNTISRATLPLGPKGPLGSPFNSTRTPPALPSVNVN